MGTYALRLFAAGGLFLLMLLGPLAPIWLWEVWILFVGGSFSGWLLKFIDILRRIR